jgi:general secretion pathway protein H
MVAIRQIAAGLREARSQAITQNREVTFTLDVASRRYRIGTSPASSLPAVINLVLDTVREEQLDAMSGSIRFFPDGSSTGGRIVLEHGRGREEIAVDWLTGRVAMDGR